jgi:RNA polymerase sigma factor (TIGR02999 family)
MGAVGERRDEVTRILADAGASEEQLLPLVYDELHQIAEQRMWGERASHTLQATALVNEAWMRLAGDERIDWRSRGHFYAAASEAMRRILVDHARRVKSRKRGGDLQRVTLGAPEVAADLTLSQVTALGDALDALAAEDERAANVARLRFLAGLSVEETARVLEVSERTVHREWTYARARLFDMLGDE